MGNNLGASIIPAEGNRRGLVDIIDILTCIIAGVSCVGWRLYVSACNGSIALSCSPHGEIACLYVQY